MIGEQELIEGCLSGNRQMQKELYRRYSGAMFALCLRYAKSRSEAQDVLQDGFVKVFTRLHQYSKEFPFAAWMRRVFVNTAISNYQKNKPFYYQEQVEDLYESDMDSYEMADCEFSYEELMSAVQELSEGYKMVFNLFAVEGFKHREIAEMMGIDVATSKSQYCRARRILQEKLETLRKERSV